MVCCCLINCVSTLAFVWLLTFSDAVELPTVLTREAYASLKVLFPPTTLPFCRSSSFWPLRLSLSPPFCTDAIASLDSSPIARSMFMMTLETGFTVKLSLVFAVPLTLTLRPSKDRLPLASGLIVKLVLSDERVTVQSVPLNCSL